MTDDSRQMTDEQLRGLLRAALPPIEPTGPADAWPRIADRLDSRPSWTVLDVALAAGIAIALVLVPQALFVLALHF